MGHFGLCTLYGGVVAAQQFCFLFVVFVFSFYVHSDKTLLISVCGVGRIDHLRILF
jgi:hypothetical protein